MLEGKVFLFFRTISTVLQQCLKHRLFLVNICSMNEWWMNGWSLLLECYTWLSSAITFGSTGVSRVWAICSHCARSHHSLEDCSSLPSLLLSSPYLPSRTLAQHNPCLSSATLHYYFFRYINIQDSKVKLLFFGCECWWYYRLDGRTLAQNSAVPVLRDRFCWPTYRVFLNFSVPGQNKYGISVSVSSPFLLPFQSFWFFFFFATAAAVHFFKKLITENWVPKQNPIPYVKEHVPLSTGGVFWNKKVTAQQSFAIACWVSWAQVKRGL